MAKKKRSVSVTLKLNKDGTMSMRSTGGFDLRKLGLLTETGQKSEDPTSAREESDVARGGSE